MTNYNLSLENQWIISFAINFLLITLAQRLPLLTKSGWIHAGILGTILLGCLGLQGWLSIFLYFALGTVVTKIGFKTKQLKGIAESRGGKRGPENVWGSAATGTFFALSYCVLGPLYSKIILIGFAASFSAKLADTFGSEIGKYWGKRTYLITSFRPVSPGTDGGISIEGTIASVIGSLLMSLVMMSLRIIDSGVPFLIIFVSGFLATLIESIIGALLQKKISWLTNELINSLQTSLSSLIAILLYYYLSFSGI